MSEKDRIPELFGSMSFNEGTMEQYVPHQAMEVWRDCLKSGKPLPLTAANDIAEAMKTWALEDHHGLLGQGAGVRRARRLELPLRRSARDL